MRALSIKAVIVVAFCVIFSVIIGTSVVVWLGQQRAQVALQQHQQAVRQATARSGADLSEVQASARALDQIMAQSTWLMLATRVFSLTMAVWLAWAIYRRVAQMVDATEGYAERIGSGDLGARFEADAGGETAALAGALNAMVQRLHAALLREAAASARLTVLLQTAPISIYSAKTSDDFAATYISPSVRQLLGYAPEDFTTNPDFWRSHVHPDDLAWALAQQAKVMRGESVAPLEYRFRHQDGSWRWMHDESALARDADGQPLELVGSWIDISVRKALEQALQRRDAILAAVAFGSTRFMDAGDEASQGQWALTLESVLTRLGEATGVQRVWLAQVVVAPNGDKVMQSVQLWADPAYAVPEADAAWLRLGINFEREGLAVEALKLRRGEMLELRATDLPELTRARYQRLGIVGELLVPISVNGQWWGVLAFDDCGGAPVWPASARDAMQAAANLFGAAFMARAEREALRHSMASLSSVVEQVKRQNTAIERQNLQLAQLSRMKSEFLASITHELRTPLNGILGFAGLLEEGVGGSLTPMQQQHVGEISAAGQELLGLVNRLLELAQLDAGATQVALAPCDIADLLAQAAQGRACAAQARGVTVTVQASALISMFDPTLMARLLNVLLDNAIKFSHPGGAVLLRAAKTEDGASMEIDVIDHGIGIAEADQERLFQPFVQLDAALARRYGGAGLGLSLARRIARLLGGDITVHSAAGAGSRFSLRLPLQAAHLGAGDQEGVE